MCQTSSDQNYYNALAQQMMSCTISELESRKRELIMWTQEDRINRVYVIRGMNEGQKLVDELTDKINTACTTLQLYDMIIKRKKKC